MDEETQTAIDDSIDESGEGSPPSLRRVNMAAEQGGGGGAADDVQAVIQKLQQLTEDLIEHRVAPLEARVAELERRLADGEAAAPPDPAAANAVD